MLAIAAAGFFYGTSQRNPKLTDKDTLVLADFSNNTGDPVFDGTLRQGLAIQLEQSPFLSLISDERIQHVLPRMGQPADARLTPALAREVCQRAGGAAVLEGSITSLGSQFVIGLRAKNCHTGDVLDEEQVQAAKKEDVLNALSQIASKFRKRIGESLATIEKYDTPLEEATTASLDALKEYSQGVKMVWSNGDRAGIPFFQRAIEIDPQFAMAHTRLGLSYMTMGESARAAEEFGKARQSRGRASDAEKFFIDSIYDTQVTGNLERAQLTFEQWAQEYPRQVEAHAGLASMIYPVFGKYEKALEQAQKVMALDPGFVIGYLQVAFNNAYLNRLPESDAVMRLAAERKLEMPELAIQRYDNAFIKGDRAGMEREVAQGAGKAGYEDWLSYAQGLTLAYSGQMQNARKKVQRAVDISLQAPERERAAIWKTGLALWEGFSGNRDAARNGATAALELSRSRDIEYGAAFALALAEDFAGAEKLAKDLEKRFPEDTAVKLSYLPDIRALSAIKDGRGSAKALELLEIAVPCELGGPPSGATGFYGVLYPVYVRGVAYLDAKRGAEAAREFQRIPQYRGVVVNDPMGALVRLQLGRAFVLSRDIAKAKAAYEEFLALWKDADPDLPVLVTAKTEYANLQRLAGI